MRVFSLFRKILIENIRDWKILILTLSFAPLFVLLMYFYVDEAQSGAYRVIVINHDVGVTDPGLGDFNAGSELILEMEGITDQDGNQLITVEQEQDMAAAQRKLLNNSVDLVVEIPELFSEVLLEFSKGNQTDHVIIHTHGDPSKPNYIMAAVWSDMITYEYAASVAGMNSPLEIQVHSVQGKETLNEFELYIPALLVLALIMLMFTAAATLIKEKDKGTIIRLRLSHMKTFEWLVAVSMVQIIIGMLALVLTYLTAVALGYESSGSLPAMMVVGFLGCLSIIALSIIVSAYLRTIFDLLTIGCFPFFILMFFSGGMFPLPPLRLFTVGTRSVNVNDVLPTTHTINAMGKILNYDSGLQELGYELVAITALTVVFFVLGVVVFTRRHMRAGA